MSKARYQIKRAKAITGRYVFTLWDTHKPENPALMVIADNSPISPEPIRQRQARLNSAYHLNEMLFGS